MYQNSTLAQQGLGATTYKQQMSVSREIEMGNMGMGIHEVLSCY